MRNPVLPVALTLILLTAAASAAPFLAADVAKTACTKTVITLDLQGLAPVPLSIGVRLTPTTDTTLPSVMTTAVRGGDGRYVTPALLLPLTEYRVEALDAVTRGVLAVDVLNTGTIATMRARASLRTPVQIRRAPRLADRAALRRSWSDRPMSAVPRVCTSFWLMMLVSSWISILGSRSRRGSHGRLRRTTSMRSARNISVRGNAGRSRSLAPTSQWALLPAFRCFS